MSGLASTTNRGIEIAPRASPNASASRGLSRPAGRGRVAVRSIFASTSRSHHMLSAFAEPVIRPIAKSAPIARTQPICEGARRSPPVAVSITIAVIRGLASARRSRAVCPGAAARSDNGRLFSVSVRLGMTERGAVIATRGY